MCAQAWANTAAAINGQEAKSQGPHLADPVESLSPWCTLTPVTAAFVTPATISPFSGQDTSVAVQGDVQLTAGHPEQRQRPNHQPVHACRWHQRHHRQWPIEPACAHRRPNRSGRSRHGAKHHRDEICIQASESITLSAGQSAIVIKDGDITFTCPGNWTVKGLRMIGDRVAAVGLR